MKAAIHDRHLGRLHVDISLEQPDATALPTAAIALLMAEYG